MSNLSSRPSPLSFTLIALSLLAPILILYFGSPVVPMSGIKPGDAFPEGITFS